MAAYVAKGPTLAKFPDATDFPALGRATPDVSALGEGFQVWTCRTLCIWGVEGFHLRTIAFEGFHSLRS